MKIALAQMHVVPGRPQKNIARMLEMIQHAKQNKVDLIAFPEMCVGGYLVGDLWRDESFCEALIQSNNVLLEASNGIAIAYGNIFLDKRETFHPNKDGTTRKYNAVYVIQNGKYARREKEHAILPQGIQVKTLLPNYRFFDDERYFFSLQDVANDFGVPLEKLEQPFLLTIDGNNVSFGFEICEDLWCEDYRFHGEALNTTKMLIANGAQFIVNISASPWTYGKDYARDKRIQFLKQESRDDFVPFFYVNCVGVQNNGKNIITFDGGSTVYNKEGLPIQFSKFPYEEEMIVVGDINTIPIQRKEKSQIAQTYDAIIQGIRSVKEMLGREDHPPFVIGLSGGIDSSVVAALVVKAVGKEKVTCLNMPTSFNSEKTKNTAKYVAEQLGIRYLVVPIEEQTACVQNVVERVIPGSLSPVQLGNLMAKIRATDILSNLAAKICGVFTNNGNKDEVILGYATLYGDVGGAVAPIADLTKREVIDMARYLNVEIYHQKVIPDMLLPDELFRFTPDQIIPSAELEKDQIDPMKFGYHCALIDAFTDFRRKNPETIMQWYLDGSMEKNLHVSSELLKRWNIDNPKEFLADLEWFYKKIEGAVFKRVQSPPIIVVSKSAYGFDIRESMIAYDMHERMHTPDYCALKKKILAMVKYVCREGCVCE